MKDWPGRLYIIMNIITIVPGDRPLMTIEYKYNSRKFLGFVANEGGGITEPCNTYLSRFPKIYYYFYVLPIFCP